MRSIKFRVLLSVILLGFLLHGYSQNKYYSNEIVDSIGKNLLVREDSLTLKLFASFLESEKLSYNFYESAYNLAIHCGRSDQPDLSYLFLQIILLNEKSYPKPDLWNRLSSKTYLLLGKYYETKGEIELAIENYSRSAKDYENFYGPDNFNIPVINITIAMLNESIFQYEEAIRFYKKNLDLITKKDTYEEAQILKLISHCFEYLDELDIALVYINKAMEIHEKNEFSKKEDLPSIFNSYGIVYGRRANWKKALYHYKKAKSTQLEYDGYESARVAFYNNNIGNIFLASGRYDSALNYYRESLTVREELLDSHSEELTHSYYNVGYAYSKLGFLDSALIYCDKSISSNLGISVDKIPFISYLETKPLSKRDYIISLTDKAEYFLTRYEKSGENLTVIKDAFVTVNKALNTSNHISNEISNYYSDLSWIVFEKRLLDLTVRIFHNYQDAIGTESNLSLISSIIKKNRVHNKYYQNHNSSLYPNTKMNEEILNINKIHLNQFLQEKGFITTKIKEESNFSQTKHTSSNYNLYDLELEEAVKTIQNKIYWNQAVIDYLVCDTILIINLITKNSIIKKVISVPELEIAASEFFSDIKKLNDVKASSRKLYNYLIKPIATYITGKDLIIIPDEFLFRIPFEGIMTPVTNSKPTYLINLNAVSYAFSIQNLIRDNKPEWNNYQYEYTGWTPYTDNPEQFILSNAGDTIFVYDYLPEAYNEVNAIDKHYKSNGKRSRIFIGSQATFQNFLDNRTNSSIIHVATHNIVDFNSPFLSHLLLFFEDTSPNKFDNIMFLPLVPYIGLKASLVILDGCETGNGKLLGSEGLLSMAHAISSNDVSSVVFSIWNISDSLAKKFVTRFIHYFSQDNNIDQAMRKVKIEMINSNYSHPCFWSGFLAYKNYF